MRAGCQSSHSTRMVLSSAALVLHCSALYCGLILSVDPRGRPGLTSAANTVLASVTLGTIPFFTSGLFTARLNQ